MRILAHVHRFPPSSNAGAEWMMLSILRWMIARGHEARAVLRTGSDYSFRGVDVVQSKDAREHYPWADVVLTHLEPTRQAMGNAIYCDRPLVHIVHNDNQLESNGVRCRPCDLVVANSRWIAHVAKRDGFDPIVVHPPVFVRDYAVPSSEHDRDNVTLVNLFARKGSWMLRELARRCPERSFLAIRGGWGIQDDGDMPENVTIEDVREDARTIYNRTRVLLMPSVYESYGRCAVEAACSAIPTVASPTIGLVEALGPAGIFASTSDIDGWIEALGWLDDDANYASAGHRSKIRAQRLATRSEVELYALEAELEVRAG